MRLRNQSDGNAPPTEVSVASGAEGSSTTRILLVCTANICRSPMGAALLLRRLDDLGVDAVVETAGLLDAGTPIAEPAVRLLADRGFDMSGHRSHRLDTELVRSATLVIGMEPRHVQEAVVLAPEVWPRAFGLKELVRRGGAIGARRDEPLMTWLARVHLGRTRQDLLTAAADGVADPHRQSDEAYRDTIDELDSLLTRFVDLAWGHAPP
jgi:protein-tyrosine-phosphatase